MAVSFDLFGTLVAHDQPDEPTVAIGEALEARGISTPPDWGDAFTETHMPCPTHGEVPLPAHVCATLESRGVPHDPATVRDAILAALDPVVEPRDGAEAALQAASGAGPVAICSNCSVPELVGLSLTRAGFDLEAFDAFVTSAGCGWRKPAPEIFEATARRLKVPARRLIHVGDQPETDGGVRAVGGTALILEDQSLREVGDRITELR